MCVYLRNRNNDNKIIDCPKGRLHLQGRAHLVILGNKTLKDYR